MEQYLKEDIKIGTAFKLHDEKQFKENLEKWKELEIKKIIRQVITFPDKLKYKYDFNLNITRNRQTMSALTQDLIKSITIDEKMLKNQIIEKIRNTFPDCKIEIDPLETYVLITWE